MDKLQQASYNAINQCLALKPEDKVVIITDVDTKEVGDSLLQEAKRVTSNVLYQIIEEYVNRPAKELPQNMTSEIKEFNPTVSIYAAQGQPGELQVFRSPLRSLLCYDLNCRHAHMISITKEIMELGMNLDLDLMNKVTATMFNIVTPATKIHVTCPHGTDITFKLDPNNRKWVQSDGDLSTPKSANLPTGEVFTAPINANGTFVGWILGDFMSEKYGELNVPIKITVEDGVATSITGPEEIVSDLNNYLNEYECCRKLGELGIGTLIGLDKFSGNLLLDEKFPGVHIAFGSPYPEETGAEWDCPTHIDTIAKNTTIEVFVENNSQIVMKDGIYSQEIME